MAGVVLHLRHGRRQGWEGGEHPDLAMAELQPSLRSHESGTSS